MISIEDKFREIFQKQDGIVAVYFFGSQVKGNTDKFSDYDLAVLFRNGWHEGIRWNIVADLMSYVFSIVGQDNADVVDLSEQPLWFQNVVVNEGKVIYESDKNARLVYEKELKKKCKEIDLGKYQDNGKMRIQDVQINLETIEENMRMLEVLSRFDYREFIEDFRNFQSAVRLLETSIQALIDASRYIIRSLGLPSAEEYRQVPVILAEHGYLEKKDADVYIEMARFRNLVVHHYHQVDSVEVYNILKDNLDDIVRWRDSLVEIIESENN